MNIRSGTLYWARELMHRSGSFQLLHRCLARGKVSLLTYHGLVRTPLPVRERCFVTVDLFTQQMEYLTRYFDVVHVEEALAFPPRPARRPLACVTFDDGLASVIDLALPILKRFRIPATVYLVTDLIDSDRTVWFTELHQSICQTSAPEVRFDGSFYRLQGPAAREKTSAELQRALKKLDRSAFAPALEALVAQLMPGGSARMRPWEPFRVLRSDEIRSTSRDGLIRFGAHSASHQILTRTSLQDAVREIRRSVDAVAALVENPSRAFAYPNGGPEDFNVSIMDAVRQAGLEYGLSSIRGPAGRESNPCAVPRYTVSDESLAHFSEIVHHTHYAVRRLAGSGGKA